MFKFTYGFDLRLDTVLNPLQLLMNLVNTLSLLKDTVYGIRGYSSNFIQAL